MNYMSKRKKHCLPISCFPSLLLSCRTSFNLWTDLKILSWSLVSDRVMKVLPPVGLFVVSLALGRILEACAL